MIIGAVIRPIRTSVLVGWLKMAECVSVCVLPMTQAQSCSVPHKHTLHNV